MILRYLSNESSLDNQDFHDKKEYFLDKNNRKGKCNSHQSHKKHKKSTFPIMGPTYPVRENITPAREQHKSPVRELSLYPVGEDHFPVTVTTHIGKKRPGEINEQEKIKRIRSRKEVFNQYASQTDGFGSEFDKESQSVQSLNFGKIKKVDNQCQIGPPLHGKMADII